MASLVEIDWPNATRQLKELADAESTARPTLSEYSDRTGVAKIPLLVLECSAEQEPGASRPCGIWSFNHGGIDEFASEYVAIADGLGMGLPGRPEGVDPLTFLLHRVSLWLLRQQQPGTGSTGFKYLNLLERPLPDDRSIRIRQIVSLIKATELYARRKCTRFGRELNEDPAPPWLQILPGSPQYPKMIDRPDGLRGRVETREEHAELFTAGWIGRNLVSIPQSEPEPTKEKQPAGSRPEPPAGTGSRGRGRPLKTAATLKAEADAVTRRAVKRQAVVMPILKRKRWKRGKLVTTSGVGKATVYGYLNGTRAWIDEDSRNAIAEVLGLDVDTLPV